MAQKKYMLLRGCFFFGKFNSAGKKIGGVEAHNTELSVTVEDTFAEHMNTCGAVAKLDARDLVERMVKMKVTVDELKNDAMAIALGGAVTSTTSGASFSAKAFATGLVVGDVVPIPGGYVNLETLTITDSTGSPVTLDAGTHYTADLKAGTIKILSLSGLTQPLIAAGSENDAFDVFSIATEGKQERWGRFSGVNLNDSNKTVVVDFNRLSFNPVEVQFKQTGNDYSSFAFEPTLIADEDADFDTTFGYYGRVVKAQ